MAAAETVLVSSSSLETGPAPAPESTGTGAATAATSPATAAAAAVAARTGSEAMVSKAALATKLLSLSGVFAVHKPKGPTSAELLNRLKEKLLAGTAARVGTRLSGRRESGSHREHTGFLRVLGSRDERKGRRTTALDLDRNLGHHGLGLELL